MPHITLSFRQAAKIKKVPVHLVLELILVGNLDVTLADADVLICNVSARNLQHHANK